MSLLPVLRVLPFPARRPAAYEPRMKWVWVARRTQYLGSREIGGASVIHMPHNRIWRSGPGGIGFVLSFLGGPNSCSPFSPSGVPVAVDRTGRRSTTKIPAGVGCECPYIIGRSCDQQRFGGELVKNEGKSPYHPTQRAGWETRPLRNSWFRQVLPATGGCDLTVQPFLRTNPSKWESRLVCRSDSRPRSTIANPRPCQPDPNAPGWHGYIPALFAIRFPWI